MGLLPSGKGTIARALASHYGLPHLDTGLLYRAVGIGVVARRRRSRQRGRCAGRLRFRHPLCSAIRPCARRRLVRSRSRVSRHHDVRAALFERQRAFATQLRGAVLDGRDIGTVIAPDADAKLFVTASVAVRAQRRA